MRSLYMVAIGFVSIQSAITAVTALRNIRTTERQTRARETQKPTTTTATTDCTHQNRTNEYNEQSMPPQVRFHDNYCCCSRLFRFVFKIVVSSRSSSDGKNERWNKQTDTFKCALRNRSVRTTNQINTQYTHSHTFTVRHVVTPKPHTWTSVLIFISVFFFALSIRIKMCLSHNGVAVA